ncbi:hypothetical protein [Microbulbifer variabilis]|uniref:hypothetical protein n=1 Tax=Microbulbifer variabilis TaxID=266805 RepID=UPI001CFDD6EA|nr:hypothetical protein [Microbulbifer variabilis]
MSQEQKLYEFGAGWVVTRVSIERKGGEGPLSFSVQTESENKKVNLYFEAPKSIDNLSRLMDVEHLIVSKDTDSQKEYGNVKIDYLDEGWGEIWCDSVHQIKEA